MVRLGGKRGSGGDYESPPPGQFVAVCAHVYDIGVQHNETFGRSTERCAIVWELSAQDSKGAPFQMIDSLPMSLFKSSKLREAAVALLRRAVDDDDEFDSDELIGKSAMLTIAHSSSGKAFVERRDALQDPGRAIAVRGRYGPGQEIPGLVAWFMRKAEQGTVPQGQGVMRDNVGKTGAPTQAKTQPPAQVRTQDIPF